MAQGRTLEAIRYSRGSLALLDQRRLPHEEVYVPCASAQDAWQMIKDMVVRGAPAIGITGALALAVELEARKASFADRDEVAAFVAKTMDYLVTSRPTAVNLADAADKLKRLAASATSGSAGELAEAMVGACERMLVDDLAANRAMGRVGCEAVLRATEGRTGGRKLRLLTHCNTGSLACAGYGTALGVVRALHEMGRVEMVYCSETRPYNQGSRLTAFELVYEGIPGTLVCDSAAASLMAQSKVDAVLVGADRITANGDTANKIGTYSHAVSAHHHGVPFFVVAPCTTLDPRMETGQEIVIEERPTEEVTHDRSGARVAAEGIAVLNPSFDVVPAALIRGIVTEKGEVPRTQDGSFDVRGHLGAAPPASLPSLPVPPGYFDLDESSAAAFVAARPALAARVGGPESAASWRVREVGDGNINFVFIVEGPLGAVVVKQGRPYVRVIGESWPLTQERIRFEAQALQEHARHCPEHVPEVFLYDPQMSALAMRYVEPPHVILRKGLVEGGVYPDFPRHCAAYMARVLLRTSTLVMDTEAHAALARRFGNVHLCRLTEQVVFTDPYYPAPPNRHTTPHLDADVAALRADSDLTRRVFALKRLFMHSRESLLHGDLHTGSFMATPTSTFVLDAEFAFVGPMGFDVGAVLANLLLAFFAADGLEAEEGGGGAGRGAQRAWLLRALVEVWERFAEESTGVLEREGRGDALPEAVYGAGSKALHDGRTALRFSAESAFFRDKLAESLGFAGCKMIRRIVGVAHVADMESIRDAALRSVCERRALEFGKTLVKRAGDFGGIRDVAVAADMARRDGREPYHVLAGVPGRD